MAMCFTPLFSKALFHSHVTLPDRSGLCGSRCTQQSQGLVLYRAGCLPRCGSSVGTRQEAGNAMARTYCSNR